MMIENQNPNQNPGRQPGASSQQPGVGSPPKSVPSDERPPEKPKKSTPFWLLMSLLVVLGVLVFSFYGLLLWSLFEGNVSNPLFEVFGIDAPNLKVILIQFTNGIFGTISLLLLIAFLSNVFRLLLTPKESPLRKGLVRGSTIWGLLFLVFVGLFITMYVVIDGAQAQTNQAANSSLILTDPATVRGLRAPVTVQFEVETKLKEALDDLNLVRRVTWDFDGDDVADRNGLRVNYTFNDKGANNGAFEAKATIRYFNQNTGQEEVIDTVREVLIDDVGVLAVIETNKDQGISPLEVELSAAQSNDPDGSIVRYEWDFDGDGSYEVVQDQPTIVAHTFREIGPHTVKLRVTGGNNEYGIAEKVITVEGGRPTLEAQITSDSGFAGEVPFEVVFDGKNSYIESGVITKFEWLFEGEKSAVLGSTQKRVYREPGQYKVTLTVENDLGERHRTEQTVTVLERSVAADVRIATEPFSDYDDVLEGSVPFEVTFDSSDSIIKSPVDWQWDFNDDDLPDEFGQKVEYVFREPGQYVVNLAIKDVKGKTHTAFKRVVVDRAGVRAKITADNLSGTMPLSVQFDGSGSSSDKGQIINYIWEFPNEDPVDYGAQISYLFRRVGTFPVKLTVINSNGERSSTEVFVSVRPPALIADFTVKPDSGAAPLTVTLDPTASQGVAREYHWDFGDGKTSRDFKPTHTYTEPGVYLIELKLVSNKGIVSRSEKRVTVTK